VESPSTSENSEGGGQAERGCCLGDVVGDLSAVLFRGVERAAELRSLPAVLDQLRP
jgi:hypothetical protein